MPVFLVALLVMRGLPALLYVRTLGRRPAVAAGLLQATSLPFLVAAARSAWSWRISPVTGAAMVSAGLLSVLIFPLRALGLLRLVAGLPVAIPRSPGHREPATRVTM